jgi:hypothetical protein
MMLIPSLYTGMVDDGRYKIIKILWVRFIYLVNG